MRLPALQRVSADLAAGIVGLITCASALLLDRLSTRLLEYALLVTPALAYPPLTFLRSRSSQHRVTTYLLVNVWYVVTYAG